MNRLKGFKGFKGMTTVGVLLSIALVFVISAMYVIPAFAIHSLTLANVTPTNVTAGQKLPSLNFTFTSGGNGNITNVLINFSVIGNNAGNFTVPASNNSVICGGKTTSLSGWVSRINATAVTCYNATQDGGARIVFNVSIINTTVGIYAPSARGLYLFNITTTDNDTEINTTAVGVDVQQITGNATTNITTVEIGKNQSIKFTIFGGSDSDKSINKIVINFTSAGFVAPVAVSCPPIGNGGNGWGAATIGANDVTCSQGAGGVLGAGASTTIILNGTTAGQTAGIQPFYVGLYDTTTGEFANFTNSTSITVFGLLNVTGTNLTPSSVFINTNGTNNGTNAIRFNFSARGEQMNITMITLLRTGTATNADVLEVAIYNGTQNATGGAFVDPSNATMIAKNTSAPDSLGRYIFTGIGFNVSAITDNFILVVFNVSRSATGGRTVGFMINNTGNITSTSAVSNVAVSETLLTGASSNATIVGNITITGTTGIAGAVPAGLRNVSVIRYNFASSGEQMNITLITLTRTGTATDADIGDIRLYNSSSDGSTVFTANATLIATNTTPDSLGRYDFNNTGLNVSTSGNQLLVVVDIRPTAVAGRTFGLFINGTGNITTRSSVSNASITETLVTEASNNATLSNFTIVGTSMMPATIPLNKNGTDNATQAARFNFSAKGEGLNISEINLTRTGSATSADVLEVAIYNTTPNATGGAFSIENATLIAKNSSAPRADGTYTFRGIALNVSAVTDTFLLIAFNVSRSATGGRTVGFMINNIANVSATGAVSGGSVNATFVSGASDNATIVGNITITGTSVTPSGIIPGSTNVSAIRFGFDASGEQMNITQIVLTRMGTATDADIPAVAIYNTSSDGANVFTANATLIAWNTSAPDSLGRYTFNVGLNVSATTDNVLLVVLNSSSSAVATRTVGFMINGTGNVTTTSGVSNQTITETLVTTSSANVTIAGNLTITGTSQIASTVSVGSRNLTFVSYNFSAQGEAMNITGINLTLTGTVSTADIESVALYNATNTTFNVDFLTEIARNSSAPRADGTYSFSGIGFNITASDRDGNILLVVVNFTVGSTTTGGKTVGFTIKAANVSVTSAISGNAITPTLVTEASNNATIVGNLTVTTTSDISANVKINQKRVAFLNLSFMARGEVVNVTRINLTLRGNASFANVSEIRLFNDDGSATGSLDATDTVIAGTATAPSSSRITFTPTDVIRLTPSTAKIIFIVFNISDESDAGAVVGVQINATDVAATTNSTNQSLSTSWTAVVSANRTITSNIDPQVLGKNAPSWASIWIPHQTILESIGRTAGTTQNFNISKILYSLRTNYRFVYYNTDGTTSGWKLFDRTDWAGSSLQYANNTNAGYDYQINMTAEDTFEL